MKIFIKVENDKPYMKTADQIVDNANDKQHAVYFVKHAQIGEYTRLDNGVIFRHK